MENDRNIFENQDMRYDPFTGEMLQRIERIIPDNEGSLPTTELPSQQTVFENEIARPE